MSTSITSDAPLRSPVAEAPHAAVQATQSAAAETSEPAAAESGARFTSPVVRVDTDTGLALLVVRDGSTGQEVDQYPSKHAVEEYKRNIPTTSQAQIMATQTSSGSAAVSAAAPASGAPTGSTTSSSIEI